MPLPSIVEIYSKKHGEIKGSGTLYGLKDIIPVYSFKHKVSLSLEEMSETELSSTIHHPITIFKEIDASTPILNQYLVTGDFLDQVIFRFYKHDGRGSEINYFTITIENANIIRIAPELKTTFLKKNEPYRYMEYVSFSYQSIFWVDELNNSEAMDSVPEYKGTVQDENQTDATLPAFYQSSIDSEERAKRKKALKEPEKKKDSEISFVFVDENNEKKINRIKTKIIYPDKKYVETACKNGTTRFTKIEKGNYELSGLDLERDAKVSILNTYHITKFEEVGINSYAKVKEPKDSYHKSNHWKTINYIAKIIEHHVKENETIADIAALYNITAAELNYFNWPQTSSKKGKDDLASWNKDVEAFKKTGQGTALVFDDENQPVMVFVPQSWTKSELASDKTYIIHLKKMSHKSQVLRLGIFFDGTGNDDKDKNKFSNIKKLRDLYNYEKFFQEETYIRGVGTGSHYEKATGGSFGIDGDERLEKAVTFVEKRLEERYKKFKLLPSKIKLDVFGFSRGAALARHFTNLINQRKISFTGDYSRALSSIISKIEVSFLGVFDTVGSFGIPGDNDDWYEFFIDESSSKYIYHLVSEDEKRKNFPVQSLIPGKSDGLSPSDFYGLVKRGPFTRKIYEKKNILEELWPGVHTDIGGGYHKSEFEQNAKGNLLSHVYLNKMLMYAVDKGVPFQKFIPNKKLITIAAQLEKIDSYYEKFDGLYIKHLNYKSVKSYLTFIEKKFDKNRQMVAASTETSLQFMADQIAYDMADQLAYDEDKQSIESTKQAVKIHKAEMSKGTGMDKIQVDNFLAEYDILEKQIHTSHSPFNKTPGMGPTVDLPGSALYRKVFKNRRHHNYIERISSVIKKVNKPNINKGENNPKYNDFEEA
ncbi:MAG: type VI secretion system tube protein Hcp [Desulfobacteraceae bacterium]|nr:type VI secretion system tube protein Hcp [Desulfobacteraceae bacterium]